MSIPEDLAAKAAEIVGAVKQTDYQHVERIDVDAGVYDCDCNGFLGLVLEDVAPRHYALLPREADQPRPRAFEYFMFFASLTPASPGGWRRIDALAEARAGDVMGWRFPRIETHSDTGHVVLIAATPTADEDGVFSVLVHDSAAQPHFDDSRGTEPGQFPTGVGSGVIRFRVDGAGRPIAFQFAPPETAQFEYLQIAIGRAEPL